MSQITTVLQSIPKPVTVVAVTKTFPPETIAAAYSEGLRHFGENYAEEFGEKYQTLSDGVRKNAEFHMIGHVQSRKAKRVVELFDWVDSVDSTKLAKKLSGYAIEKNKILNILLGVNVSGEPTKFGFDLAGWQDNRTKLDAFMAAVREIGLLPNLSVCGLMVMPPLVKNAEENRPIFQSAKRLFVTVKEILKSPNWKHLSMGTSQDYRVAIEEGATLVRLGEVFFGKRL